MSVFTPVSTEQLAAWLAGFDVGRLVALEGIAEGVQNSNFFVTTEDRQYVLTLFENVDTELLPFYLDLMAHLSAHGIACPAPVPDRRGTLLGTLNGRPAALFSRLSGASVATPSAAQCAMAGAALARLHLAGASFPAPPHPRGAAWIAATARRVMPLLGPEDAALLAGELDYQQQARPALPAGVIHADLFRDNVLFLGPQIGGLLDFYFAGYGEWLFDLAIVANDWCSQGDAALDDERLQALLGAYHAVRPLTDAERQAWPCLLRAAALRFWLSRLEDFHCPRSGEAVTVRDPDAYRRILQQRMTGPTPWLPLEDDRASIP